MSLTCTSPIRTGLTAGLVGVLLAVTFCTGAEVYSAPTDNPSATPPAATEARISPGRPPGLDPAFDGAPGFGSAKAFLQVPASTNLHELSEWQQRIHMARSQREKGDFPLALANLQAVLDGQSDDSFKKTALLELAFTQQMAQQFPEAIKSYGIFLKRFQNDAGLPEVLLRQGLLYREIGASTAAIAKFHSVMSTALNLNMDEFEYYRKIVLLAQTQIAETLYSDGKFDQAADKFQVLLRNESTLLDREAVQYRLILCLHGLKRHSELIASAQDYLARSATTGEAPHVRYLLSLSLKDIGRNGEALSQVMTLLQTASTQDSENWRAWRQRTGNEIANRLYLDADYPRALDLYLNLVGLDSSPEWQFPVWYQIGLTHEHMKAPQQAVAAYQNIIDRTEEIPVSAGPGTRTLVDMARWRRDFIQWKLEAERSKVILQQPADPRPAASQL
ncbi:MAG TPA: hypothetical protein DCY13_02350 [Verrucomicrobiales bacterium]|nr:hypothetical protein [Verrucomicrobiales bacterium]